MFYQVERARRERLCLLEHSSEWVSYGELDIEGGDIKHTLHQSME
jgi:hypothetical protein